MTYQRRQFDTCAEAEAFLEGLRYVNDSAIEPVGTECEGGKWFANFFDYDQKEDQDENQNG